MYLSRIPIDNFRNFSNFNVALSGNVVIVGENRVGKSNLLYAIRLLFDPTLPDGDQQLRRVPHAAFTRRPGSARRTFREHVRRALFRPAAA
jgi:putative ATP-dependent endonuclease of OLD family